MNSPSALAMNKGQSWEMQLNVYFHLVFLIRLVMGMLYTKSPDVAIQISETLS